MLLSHVWLFGTPWIIQPHGILQARVLEWVAFPFSRGSFQPRDQTQVYCIAGGFLTSWATREALPIASQSVSSVAQSCLTLCSPVDCSMLGFPVHNQLLSLLKLMSIESVMPSNHLIPCHLFSSGLQSFPASGSFPMSQFFTLGAQSTGVSASASVLPMNIQDWFPLGWTGWISLHSKWLSRVFFNITAQKHQFFGTQLSL